MPKASPSPDKRLFPDGIRDNRARGSVADFLRDQIEPGSFVRVVSAYFTIHAYDALSSQFDSVQQMRFLFGEPSFLNSLDPERSESKAFRIEDDELGLTNRLRQREVARRCARWFRERTEVRSVRDSGLLHGKLYHIDDRHREHALVGSSNLTLRGLGLAPKPNIELNLVVDGDRDRTELREWFDELWADEELACDVKAEVLAYLDRLYANHSPNFIYLKTLYHLFGDFLAGEEEAAQALEQTAITATGIWQALYPFQRDAAKGVIRKINDFGGCILADSVGLGKTYTALAVIKYFELRNFRVLVLCPKKLCDNWRQYLASAANRLNPFPGDRFAFTVLAHTDLSRQGGRSGAVDLAAVNWGGFDLVVIDESHNFRNNSRGRGAAPGEERRPSRYERLMNDVVRAGGKSKVLLLSATPVNNSLADLRNQLSFITEGDDAALLKPLGIASLQLLLATAQHEFNHWAQSQGEHRGRDLLDRLPTPLFKLLDGLSIARSRRQLRRYYGEGLAAYGDFPKRQKPESITSQIDLHDQFLTYDHLVEEMDKYKLSLFNPTKYLRQESAGLYPDEKVTNFTQAKREDLLIGMMKVNFLKRLESSVNAFAITMDNTVGKIEDLERRLQAYLDHKRGVVEVQVDAEGALDPEDEEAQEAFEVGKARTFHMDHLHVADWLADLRQDREQLESLGAHARRVGPRRDAKLAALKTILEDKFTRPTTRRDGSENRKVLVFTAFADTAVYLYRELASWSQERFGVHCGLVTGVADLNQTTLGHRRYQDVLTNFAPRAKHRAHMDGMPQGAEIDLLIATDCISEGQNLQDCDLLINYDIHWNPVRIIQRFGRIDRLGSLNPSVRLVNFWPTQDLNRYINLKNRVEARMALVDLAATADDNLLAGAGLEDLIEDELRYRDRQLLRMRNEILDMEDFTESVNLTDFSLEDFRAELAAFVAHHRRELADAPLGLYSVVPAAAGAPSGVIFCLRQQGTAGTVEALNPLQPYFLVYVLDGGEIRFNFAQSRQVLDAFRSLASGKIEPHAELCAWFDRETGDGADMTRYSALLQAVAAAIVRQFGRRAGGSLLTGRSALLPGASAQPRKADDFELVTWLVIAPAPASQAVPA